MKTMKLRKLIKRYVQAEVNDSWKGGGDPKDIPQIEKELREAGNELIEYLKWLETYMDTADLYIPIKTHFQNWNKP